MGIIIIAIILGMIIGFIDIEEIGAAVAGGFLGFLVGIILYLFIGGLIGCFLPTTEIVEEYEICALKDTSEIEGRHYLFSGYIDEELVFRYVVKTEKGKHIEEIEGVESVYINEGDYTPMVKVYRKELAEYWYYWFAWAYAKEYVFYVPENTVTNEYNIDLN